jgi:EAL domain-containing protein (putative c-di-GMP-specific phosphodiesterase class I)
LNGNDPRPASIGAAIHVDEIGIETGRFGGFRLKTAYQPIFQRMGRSLLPIAVEGLVAPYRDGQAIDGRTFFDAVPAAERLFVESLCRCLHIRNHHNVGVPTLRLYFNYDPRANADLEDTLREIRTMAGCLVEVGLDPRLLVCEITEASALDESTLVAVTEIMRALGMRIAVGNFGAGRSTYERVARILPDIVKIDGALFRSLCRDAAAARLFGPLVQTIRRTGAEVLAEGIETPAELRIAIDARVDLLQGHLLGRPALAGTIFREDPLPLERLLASNGDNVIPLFG